jgi:CO/xanthine dehydrogenase FAD-binding subunit
LRGKTVNAQLAAEVASIVAEDIQPVSDLRGSSEFRRDGAHGDPPHGGHAVWNRYQ